MNAEKRKWLKRRSAENEWKFWTRICSMEGGMEMRRIKRIYIPHPQVQLGICSKFGIQSQSAGQ
jgi:hypothetical protein